MSRLLIFLSLFHFFSDRFIIPAYKCGGNLANSKSISGDIDRDPVECRANKSVDDGVQAGKLARAIVDENKKTRHEARGGRGRNSFPA